MTDFAGTALKLPGKIEPSPVLYRLRLGVRWARFALRSVRAGNFDFAWNAARAEVRLTALSFADLFPGGDGVCCNVCGWTGRTFYPNVGPGYDERATTCPGCGAQDRHRALIFVLATRTTFFTPGTEVREVAPFRGLQSYYLSVDGLRYRSFDLERYAMEQADICDMPYEDGSVDYFLCFHVLEHIPDEAAAMGEIARILKPGGTVVLQVPVDWDAEETREFDAPDPRDANHVRQYGADFGEKIAAYGFDVEKVSVADCVSANDVARFGLSAEPIFLARKRS